MAKLNKYRKQAIVLYVAAISVFLLFFGYIAFFENTFEFESRQHREFHVVTGDKVETVIDETAPAGTKIIHHWLIRHASNDNNSMTFYAVQSFVRVFVGDELAYELLPSENNKITKNPGSTWVSIPIYPEDNGKTVTVEIIPAFEKAICTETEFLVGSKYEIFYSVLHDDLPELLLSLGCMVVGVFVSILYIFLWIKKWSKDLNIFFCGNFLILLGISCFTGTKAVSLAFATNTVAVTYLHLGTLLICIIPILLYMKSRFHDFDYAPMYRISMIVSLITVAAVVLQIFGVFDFSELLPFIHFLIIVSIVAVVVSALVRFFKNHSTSAKKSVEYSLLLFIGVIMDLIVHYAIDKNEGIFWSIVAFVIYMVIIFMRNILEISSVTYRDSLTGLYNRNHWNRIMKMDIPFTSSVSIMMFDLNNLKSTNDNLGHEAGDKAIFNFAHILLNVLPPNCVICRWGGDEFSVLVTDSDKEQLERISSDLRAAVEEYNANGTVPEIYYARGCASSFDYPDFGKEELFEKADEMMYMDKHRWYSERH